MRTRTIDSRRWTLVAGCLAAIAGGACTSDDGGGLPRLCQPGTTQACTCTSGDPGAQVCDDDTWLACVCDGTPVCANGSTQACVCGDGTVGVQGCAGETWSSCACAAPPDAQHGDLCTAPAYACGTNLSCVVDAAGDAQGICRVPCQSDLSCVEDDRSWNAGDTNCCDVGNGTRACFAPFVCE